MIKGMIKLRNLLMIGLVLGSQLVIAAPEASVSAPTNTALSSSLGSSLGSGLGPAQSYLLQSMLILGGLLVLLMGAMKLLRKSGHIKSQSGQRLKVVEAVSLGGSDRAVLIRVGSEEVLLGVSQGRVAPLMMVNPAGESDLVATGEANDENQTNGSALQQASLTGGFSQLLNRLRS